ncbi:MAG: BrnT family toxin [Edaphobacter sp.]
MGVLKLGNLEFEWDDAKAAANLSKHAVSFPEAATAFLDTHAEMVADIDHSEEEDRFVLLAISARLRILVVIHAARGLRVRIISARTATANERRRYDATRDGGR